MARQFVADPLVVALETQSMFKHNCIKLVPSCCRFHKIDGAGEKRLSVDLVEKSEVLTIVQLRLKKLGNGGLSFDFTQWVGVEYMPWDLPSP